MEKESRRLLSFHTAVKLQITMLNKMVLTIDQKYNEIKLMLILNNSKNFRNNRGCFNFLGSIWKAISENLDSDNIAYYDNCVIKAVFISQIPLTEHEEFKLLHIYSVPDFYSTTRSSHLILNIH